MRRREDDYWAEEERKHSMAFQEIDLAVIKCAEAGIPTKHTIMYLRSLADALEFCHNLRKIKDAKQG
jgi:hypothetical protein